MIKELSELGMKLRTTNSTNIIVHNALKEEPLAIDLVVREDGSFVDFVLFDKKMTTTEAITAKKGKARLLVDKVEEVLAYSGMEIAKGKENLKKKGVERELTEEEMTNINKGVSKKHALFWDKIQDYKGLTEIQPILRFYESNRINGVERALSAFEEKISEKERGHNIAFRINDKRIHESSAVIDAIIGKYLAEQKGKLSASSKTC